MLLSNSWIALALVAVIQVVTAQVPNPTPNPAPNPDLHFAPVSNQRSTSYQYVENQLPTTPQTHEVIMVTGSSVMLISQLSNSVLLKASVDANGVVKDVGAFQIGSPNSRLHGLVNSQVYPGQVWVTLQEDNILLRIDPKVNDILAPPTIEQIIRIQEDLEGCKAADGTGVGCKGPHYVGEYGDELWTTLQDSSHVLRINHKFPSNYAVYKAQPRPIFIAKHPVNNMFYTGQDNSASVMKIDPTTGVTTQIPIPGSAGQTPVGMVSGPNGIWFTLLGTNTSGTGTFGHIGADDTIKYHKLNSTWGKDASLLHLGMDPDMGASHTVWLLSSSIIYTKALDSVIKVVFDPTYQTIVKEEVTALPTQECKAHRIWLTPTAVFATELTSAKVFAWTVLKSQKDSGDQAPSSASSLPLSHSLSLFAVTAWALLPAIFNL
ncbi:MAG: hypothetical protein J3Q66DRAFT_333593 [Benniella sp.]|nr:MAG: hypothetical protein J3Q66DRAFT_333593 [Benniella sp.]